MIFPVSALRQLWFMDTQSLKRDSSVLISLSVAR